MNLETISDITLVESAALFRDISDITLVDSTTFGFIEFIFININ